MIETFCLLFRSPTISFYKLGFLQTMYYQQNYTVWTKPNNQNFTESKSNFETKLIGFLIIF